MFEFFLQIPKDSFKVKLALVSIHQRRKDFNTATLLVAAPSLQSRVLFVSYHLLDDFMEIKKERRSKEEEEEEEEKEEEEEERGERRKRKKYVPQSGIDKTNGGARLLQVHNVHLSL